MNNFTNLGTQLGKAAELEKCGKFDDARQILEACKADYPKYSSPPLRLAGIFRQIGVPNSAKELYRKVFFGDYEIDNEPIYAGAFIEFCELLLSDGQSRETMTELDNLCRRDVERHGPKSWSALYQGAIAFVMGFEHDAEKHFRRCVELGDSPLGNYFGSFTYSGNDTVEELLSYTPQRTARTADRSIDDLRFKPTPNDKFIYHISCDNVYFDHFADAMATSVHTHASGGICHLHLLNPDQNTFAGLERIRRQFPSLRLNITGETIQFDPNALKLNKKAYYTCGRFLRLPFVMQYYGLPVIVSEFDADLCTNLEAWMSRLREIDFAVSFYDRTTHFPWNRIWAGSLYLPRTDIALRYATLVSKYCSYFLDKGDMSGFLWHVDQNALYCVFRYLSTANANLKIVDLKKMPALVKHYGGLY